MGRNERRVWNVVLLLCYLLLALLVGWHSARAQDIQTTQESLHEAVLTSMLETAPADVFEDDDDAQDILNSTRATLTRCIDGEGWAYAVSVDPVTRVTCGSIREPFADWLDRYEQWLALYRPLLWASPWQVDTSDEEGLTYSGGFVRDDGQFIFIYIAQAYNSPDVGAVTIVRTPGTSEGK